MSTLVLRLAAPLQSWGSASKFDIRRTHTEPTKSGVIGLLMAALGCPRDDDKTIHLLDSKLHMGIRVDRPGTIVKDFHTVHPAKGAGYVTYRQYLSDAVFLVGLESEDEKLIKRLEKALNQPAHPLALGRRACPPTLPLVLGVKSTDLEKALRSEACQDTLWRRTSRDKVARLFVECSKAPHDAVARQVQGARPISFNPEHREYDSYMLKDLGNVVFSQIKTGNHDPFAEMTFKDGGEE